jgi:hypothetical protein
MLSSNFKNGAPAFTIYGMRTYVSETDQLSAMTYSSIDGITSSIVARLTSQRDALPTGGRRWNVLKRKFVGRESRLIESSSANGTIVKFR